MRRPGFCGVQLKMRMLALAAGALLAALTPPAEAQSTEKLKVTAQVAYTRSGPGEYWYVTGQLKRGDVVTVVGQQRGWAEILAPAGHYSLVLKSHVDPQGVVIGNTPVPVRAGEHGGKRLNKIQTYLVPGPTSKVVIHREIGPYYQIAPPPGVTVFIKSDLLDGNTEDVTSTTTPPADPAETSTTHAPPVQPEPEPVREPVAGVRPPTATQPQDTSSSLNEVRARIAADQQMMRDELAKPLLDRDYSALLARFQQIKDEPELSKVEGMLQYADVMIAWVNQQTRVQSAARTMSTTRPDIDEAIAEARRQVAPLPAQPPYQATGILRRSEALGSSVAMPNLHRLDAVEGRRVICYVVPGETDDWTAVLGKQVQITGRREYRADWNFHLVYPQQVTVVGEGPVQPQRRPDPAASTDIDDTPPDITPLLPGNIFIDDAPPPAGAQESMPPADERPMAPVPELRPLPPPDTATQPD